MDQPRLSGTRPREARQANTAAVLQLLAQRGPLARGDIARELSLNHGSVSRIIEPLLSDGVLRELVEQRGGVGRPRMPVALDPTSRYAVGVHLGLEHITAGVIDLSGRCVRTHTEDHDPADRDATLARAGDLAAEMAHVAAGPVLGVGVAVGGEVDRLAGRVVRNDVLGWTGVPVADRLRARTGLGIVVDGNVRALLGAELAFGVGLGLRSVLYLFIGNVAEMGFLVPHGPDGIIEGGLGRILVPDLTGGHARLGECGTDVALLAAARSAGLAVTSLSDLVRLAEADQAATDLLRARSTQVAVVADTMHELLRPNVIVLGGSGAPSDRWLAEVRDRVDVTPPEALVRPSPSDSPLVTAAAGLVVRAFLTAGGAQ